jgi:hypothetical protein
LINLFFSEAWDIYIKAGGNIRSNLSPIPPDPHRFLEKYGACM